MKHFNIGGKVQGWIKDNHIHFYGTNELGDFLLFPMWPRLKNIEKFFEEYSMKFEILWWKLWKQWKVHKEIEITGFSLGGPFVVYFLLLCPLRYYSVSVKVPLDDPLRGLTKKLLRKLDKKYIYIKFITYKKGNSIAHHWPPKVIGYKDYPGKIIKVKYKYKNFWEWLSSPLKDHTRSINEH